MDGLVNYKCLWALSFFQLDEYAFIFLKRGVAGWCSVCGKCEFLGLQFSGSKEVL
jgi:hypothetical protein